MYTRQFTFNNCLLFSSVQNTSNDFSETDLYEEISVPPLTAEQENATSLSDVIMGRRVVVDLGYVLTQYEQETAGLHSSLYSHCDNCDKTVALSNQYPSKQKYANKSVVWGCLSTGIGHRCQWDKYLYETMQKAGKKEKQTP
ncbi:hypothetical protein ILUMI_06919 [Ignelater luminosus]|uniref:Uncharacterized protein n=1 Tax=Ignelater luminosus TaxID=2038154 RepID=A0A8K0D9A4_IGNLU|nr:hypothetical protein ILUMI_06919 [Ignelater luminosus]